MKDMNQNNQEEQHQAIFHQLISKMSPKEQEKLQKLYEKILKKLKETT